MIGTMMGFNGQFYEGDRDGFNWANSTKGTTMGSN